MPLQHGVAEEYRVLAALMRAREKLLERQRAAAQRLERLAFEPRQAVAAPRVLLEQALQRGAEKRQLGKRSGTDPEGIGRAERAPRRAAGAQLRVAHRAAPAEQLGGARRGHVAQVLWLAYEREPRMRVRAKPVQQLHELQL